MSDAETTPTTDESLPAACVAGEDFCGGPLHDDLPCWECFRYKVCPAGYEWCDGRAGVDEQDVLCMECATRGSSTPVVL